MNTPLFGILFLKELLRIRRKGVFFMTGRVHLSKELADMMKTQRRIKQGRQLDKKQEKIVREMENEGKGGFNSTENGIK